MRLVLAFLALLALLSAPVTAAAAQVACAHDGPMTNMDMSVMPGVDQAGAAKTNGDPCCDQAGHHGKQAGCIQACAAMCSVTAALVSAPFSVVFTPMRVETPSARIVSSHPYEPPGLKRPPKSIA